MDSIHFSRFTRPTGLVGRLIIPRAYLNRLSESLNRINTGFLRPDFSFSPTSFTDFNQKNHKRG